MKTLIVVDCQNDFITGSLACQNALTAVQNIIDQINNNDVFVIYSCDWHSPTNKSFKEFGGIWPRHCVQDSFGSKIHEDFYEKIKDIKNRPNETNVFYKGINDDVEEYSAVKATNKAGLIVEDVVTDEILVGGLATEYCVKETVLALKETHNVKVIEKCLGFVNKEDHDKTILEFEDRDLVAKNLQVK